MRRRSSALLLAAFVSLASAMPARAESRAAPGQNSGLTEYLEAVPSATGNRSPEAGSPAAGAVDARTKNALSAHGKVGEKVLGMAASPDHADGPRTSRHRRRRSPKRAARPVDRSSRRSGPSGVATGLGGGGTGLGVGLPIVLLLGSAGAAGAWFLKRRHA